MESNKTRGELIPFFPFDRKIKSPIYSSGKGSTKPLVGPTPLTAVNKAQSISFILKAIYFLPCSVAGHCERCMLIWFSVLL
jgi:hypothetical protein